MSKSSDPSGRRSASANGTPPTSRSRAARTSTAHSSSRINANDGLRENLAISGAKSLYDALIGEARGKEPRVAVAVAEIKQGMADLSIQPRWIPHNVMIVDGMTKELSRSNLLPLLNCMRDGTYQMRSEKDEKTYREDLKAAGKTLARLKGKSRSEE